MIDLIESAYRKTRSMIYYERISLHTRHRFAKTDNYSEFVRALVSRLAQLVGNPWPNKSEQFRDLLDEISVVVCPKGVETQATLNTDTFHTNVDWDSEYSVSSYNIFIDCPPELHVISTLWVMTVGSILANQVPHDSYGWTLHPSARDLGSPRLFEYYVPQYAKWRDTAINLARRTVGEDHQNATIVGLDLKQFFYHVVIDWDEIARILDSADWGNDSLVTLKVAKRLHLMVKSICVKYKEVISTFCAKTHPAIDENTTPLPLGIGFSPVLANWALAGFDRLVQKELSPVYYGRYVDDMIFVIASNELPFDPGTKDPSDAFLEHYFIKRKILKRDHLRHRSRKDDEKAPYRLEGDQPLVVQPKKVQIHHFDAQGSLGALDKFRDNIREIVSEFRFLPEAIPTEKLEALSSELLYDGSKQSLRSVKGFDVNQWQLSLVLATAAMTRIFAEEGKKLDEESAALNRLLKGVVGLRFYNMWEKVFAMMLLGGEFAELRRMYWRLNKCISAIKANCVPLNSGGDSMEFSPELTERVTRFLRGHLDLSLALTLSLAGKEHVGLQKHWKTKADKEVTDRLGPMIDRFRESNLVRHHFVGCPLINFTSDRGDWTVSRTDWKGVVLQEDRVLDSPRFIHLDEFEHSQLLAQLGGADHPKSAVELYERQLPSHFPES